MRRRFLRFLVSHAGSRLGGWPASWAEVVLSYHKNHGRFPRLLSPQRFTEKIQWRKLFDLNPLYTTLTDKIAVRDYVRARVSADHLIPLLWVGDDPAEIPFDTLDPPYVIKSSHAWGHVVLVRQPDPDQDAIREQARAWLRQNHGLESNEAGYANVQPRLLIERLLLQRDGSFPREMHMWVFDGRVGFMQLMFIDRGRSWFSTFHEADWRPLTWRLRTPPPDTPPAPPDRLRDCIRIAERLGEGLDYVRVDLYLCDEALFVGELTLYSQSGMQPITPDEADNIIGERWKLKSPKRRALRALLSGRRRIKADQSRN